MSNGAMAGTVGRGLQLEAIKINVKSDADIGVIDVYKRQHQHRTTILKIYVINIRLRCSLIKVKRELREIGILHIHALMRNI